MRTRGIFALPDIFDPTNILSPRGPEFPGVRFPLTLEGVYVDPLLAITRLVFGVEGTWRTCGLDEEEEEPSDDGARSQ